jgi:hypothetical protein
MTRSLSYKRTLVCLIIFSVAVLVVALPEGLAQDGNGAHSAVNTKSPVTTPGLPGMGRPPFGKGVTFEKRQEIPPSASEILQMRSLDASSIFLAAQTYSSGGNDALSIAVGDVDHTVRM